MPILSIGLVILVLVADFGYAAGAWLWARLARGL